MLKDTQVKESIKVTLTGSRRWVSIDRVTITVRGYTERSRCSADRYTRHTCCDTADTVFHRNYRRWTPPAVTSSPAESVHRPTTKFRRRLRRRSRGLILPAPRRPSLPPRTGWNLMAVTSTQSSRRDSLIRTRRANKTYNSHVALERLTTGVVRNLFWGGISFLGGIKL